MLEVWVLSVNDIEFVKQFDTFKLITCNSTMSSRNAIFAWLLRINELQKRMSKRIEKQQGSKSERSLNMQIVAPNKQFIVCKEHASIGRKME